MISIFSLVLRTVSLGILTISVVESATAVPAVTLSPTTNHPQGATKVSGSGFGLNEAVDIYYDTTDVVLDVIDGAGNFGTDKLTIAASALPGDHWITVIGRRDGDAAHKKFIVSTAWVSHGFNERGRRRNPYENVINVSTVFRLDLAWSAATNLNINSSPAISQIGSTTYGPLVFVGSNDANLYAFDINGAFKWSQSVGSGTFASPTIANGNVYIGDAGGNVHAFKAATGVAAWASPVPIGGDVESSPAVANGVVYVASNSQLHALSAADGHQIWSAPSAAARLGRPPPFVALFQLSSPAVTDGIVYIGAADHNLYAFKTSDGTAAWASPAATGGVIQSSPAVANGVVYVGSQDGKLYAFNAKTGAAAWPSPFTTGGAIESSPAVANNVVYVGADDGKLYAININTGANVWTSIATGAAIGTSSPAVANGVVFVGSQDKKVYAFTTSCASICSPVWSASTGDQITSSPAVSDGMMFVGSLDHSLYAFAEDAGNAAVYRQRHAVAPSYAALHPDFRLRPVRRAVH